MRTGMIVIEPGWNGHLKITIIGKKAVLGGRKSITLDQLKDVDINEAGILNLEIPNSYDLNELKSLLLRR